MEPECVDSSKCLTESHANAHGTRRGSWAMREEVESFLPASGLDTHPRRLPDPASHCKPPAISTVRFGGEAYVVKSASGATAADYAPCSNHGLRALSRISRPSKAMG